MRKLWILRFPNFLLSLFKYSYFPIAYVHYYCIPSNFLPSIIPTYTPINYYKYQSTFLSDNFPTSLCPILFTFLTSLCPRLFTFLPSFFTTSLSSNLRTQLVFPFLPTFLKFIPVPLVTSINANTKFCI